MLQLTLKAAKGTFFDRESVIKAEDAATRKALSKFGAYVRTRARSSIRPRKDVSRPGQPPSSHVGTLKKLIFFGYDKERRSVVIGPTLLQPDSKVPSLLEFGGTVATTGADGKQSRVLRYRPRPFMRPAFDEESKRVSDIWRNSIKG